MKAPLKLTGLCALLFTASLPALAQQSVEDRVAAIKGSLAASQAVLRQYEWVESTVVSLKGEEKALTSYPDSISLEATKKKVEAAVDNSGYRKMGN